MTELNDPNELHIQDGCLAMSPFTMNQFFVLFSREYFKSTLGLYVKSCGNAAWQDYTATYLLEN